MAPPVVEVENLTKVFKTLRAVDRVSFELKAGEILGLLGPNPLLFRPSPGIFRPLTCSKA